MRVLGPARRGLVGAAMVVVVGSLLAGAHRTDPSDRLRLASGSDVFLLEGSVSGLTPADPTTVLRLTATNLLRVPITVTSVTARITSATYRNGTAAPAVCSSYLSPAFTSGGSGAGSHTWSSLDLAVGANRGQATVTQPLLLSDDPTVNQDACQGVTFALAYTGNATYLETYATATTLTASANPPVVGQPVTYTATVTANPTAGQDTPASPPTGTVAFTDNGAAIGGCTNVAVTAGSGLASTARCTTTFPTLTAHAVVASFTNTDGNFGAGSSPALVAAGACVTTPTTTAGTVVTSTVTGNVQVRSGQSYWLRGGTFTGNVTVDAGGQFTGTGGSIRGNLIVNGTTALSGTAVGGSVTATGAGLAVSDAATVAGNVTAQGSGPLCLVGVTVSGGVTAQSLRGTVTSSVCGSTVRGALVVQSSAVPILVGSGSTCAGDTVAGGVTVQANSAPVTIQSTGIGGSLVVQSTSAAVTIGGTGLANTVGGSLTAQGNTGGGTVVATTISGGSCLLQSNSPQYTGSANTVRTGATNSCNGRG